VGRVRRRRVVTGIGSMMAGGGPYAPSGGGSTGPLACTIGFSAGAGPFNVAGASGDLASQGYGIIRSDITGGTPPYTETVTVQGDVSAKLSIVSNGLGADTIGYSAFALNEIEGGYLRYNVTDNAGLSATGRFPPAGALNIKRTS
jgi:hypothetical protein